MEQRAKQDAVSPQLPFRLGCPVWNCEHWSGSVFPTKTPKREWLSWYTRMFNTVEGNSSFYAIPALQHAQRWAAEAATGFEFCMKLPREITHDRMLVGASRPTAAFIEVLRALQAGGCLGPSFLQLGPKFGPSLFRNLETYLNEWPKDLPLAVEVRHLGWFDEASNERRLDELLVDCGVDRVLFDSRPLYQAEPDDEIERVSQTRKPKSPLRHTVSGQRPMLRIVGRNRVDLVDPFIREWTPVIAEWIRDGLEPIIFTHAPDDRYAPEFARRMYQALCAALPNGLIADHLPTLPKQPQQLDLFG
ncbi:MAG: DUF72 domain-containing protein [Planctomycetota bacterium]